MKSRTSFFNGAVFRKNLGRFFPLWGGYTLCLILGMVLMMNDNLDYWFAAHLASMASGMSIINFGYAMLTAQTLFGDLWNTRMCHGLHALPMRRECWFHTQVFSGLFFSLIPTAILAGAATPVLLSFSKMENAWQIPLYFLLACNLEYLFFFGAAAFAALCAGNRTGMTIIYAIINLGSYLAYFFVDTLITPMYYGAVTQGSLFELLCPVAQITKSSLMEYQRHEISIGFSTDGDKLYDVYGTFWLGDGWIYLLAVALVGLVLLAIAKQLYRWRKLECAGDFLASGKLAPIFMVIFSLSLGVVFQFMPEALGIAPFDFPLFLYIGVVVGWFAGRMLLERQVRVFRRGKTWLGLLLTLTALVCGMYGLSLDPLGIEDWVPSTADIKKASIINGYRGVSQLETQEDIETLTRIHRSILEDKLTPEETDRLWQQAIEAAQKTPQVQSGEIGASQMADKLMPRQYTTVRIEYVLKNGLTVNREYLMWVDTEAGQLAKPYLNRISAIFYAQESIQSEADLQRMIQMPNYVYISGYEVPQSQLSEQMAADLVAAIVADSKEGTLAQTNGYHPGFVWDQGDQLYKAYSVDIQCGTQDPEFIYFSIYTDSKNCLKWMEDYGLLEMIHGHWDAEMK